jgi:hypothetical protein
VRRSTFVRMLACIQAHRLLTEEEMSGFSPKIRETVAYFAGPARD